MTKVGAYVPAYNEQLNANITAQALNDMISCVEQGINYRWWAAHSCDLIAMRNQALHKALSLGLDYLFMQDSDVFSTHPGGPVLPMLETCRKTGAAVVGAIVSMRTDPPRANTWPCIPGEVFEAEKFGTGMVLIDLNQIREWYDDYDGPCFARTYKSQRMVTPDVGSDVFFCKIVRGHGQKLFVDGRIPTVHINACHRLPYDGKQAPTDLAEPETGPADPGDAAAAVAPSGA